MCLECTGRHSDGHSPFASYLMFHALTRSLSHLLPLLNLVPDISSPFYIFSLSYLVSLISQMIPLCTISYVLLRTPPCTSNLIDTTFIPSLPYIFIPKTIHLFLCICTPPCSSMHDSIPSFIALIEYSKTANTNTIKTIISITTTTATVTTTATATMTTTTAAARPLVVWI